MEAEKKAAKITYTKEKILASASYKDKRDLLSVLLEDGGVYTKAQVNGIIETYLKGKVN